MKTALSLAAVSVAALSLASPFALADNYFDWQKRNRWSLFGEAEVINQPVALTSTCVGSPCDFATLTFSGVSYKVKKRMKFSDINELSTYFNRTDDDCGAGSPRFQISLDTDGDDVHNGNIFVYLGPLPNYTGCPASWQSSGNLIQSTESRFDLTQLGGAFYDTYANALAMHGSARVLGISVVVDSGWNGPATGGDGEQTILIANTSVNGNKLSIEDGHDD